MKRLVCLLFALSLLALPACSGSSGPNPVVVIDTSMGPIKAELYQDKAPVTVKNFLQYADDKFYDGTVFHRVIPGFMIQGGGFTTKLQEKQTRAAIYNEAGNGVANNRGTLAMARTNDPNSATAQFFINLKYNDFLDRNPKSPGYAVFGKVVDEPSMEVVDKIAEVKTGKIKGMDDVPEEPVIIKSIRRVEVKTDGK